MLTDRPYMTIAVDWDVKYQTKQTIDEMICLGRMQTIYIIFPLQELPDLGLLCLQKCNKRHLCGVKG